MLDLIQRIHTAFRNEAMLEAVKFLTLDERCAEEKTTHRTRQSQAGISHSAPAHRGRTLCRDRPQNKLLFAKGRLLTTTVSGNDVEQQGVD